MSRAYRPADFEGFLRKYSDTSLSRQSEQTDRAQMDCGSRAGSHSDRQSRDQRDSNRDNFDRFRTTYRDRNREYSLRESEVRTLIDLGKFRVVPADDLARLGYRGDRSRMENDVQHLRHQGLIEQRSIEGHESHSKQVLTLTKEGQKLLSRHNFVPHGQAIYRGFVKPKEARHDADLYRLYHKVAREIDEVGGEVRRVVLDYELKQGLYKKLSRVDPNKKLAYERIRVANEYDLKVVNDKIPVPDLRIEYEDECRDLHRLETPLQERRGIQVLARPTHQQPQP